MRTSCLLLGAVCVVLLRMDLLRAESPLAVIERALQAQGGAEKLARAQAIHMTIKGVQLKTDPFTCETFSQGPDHYKDIQLMGKGEELHAHGYLLKGNKSWSLSGTVAIALEDKDQTRLWTAYYKDHILDMLRGLPRDKTAKLTALGESNLDGRVIVGVKVVSKNFPEYSLYFDKANGLLVKAEFPFVIGEEEDAKTATVLYSDYREADCAVTAEKTLKAANQATDAQAVLQLVRQRTLTQEKRQAIKDLIQRLGSDTFEEREKAEAEIRKLGALALPVLAQNRKHSDAEVARRVAECIKAIEDGDELRLIEAAIHLAARRKSEGTVEMLLAYVQAPANDRIRREALAALAALAHDDGKPDKTLLEALKDTNPIRRTAAEAVLGRDGGAYEKLPGRRLYISGLKFPRKIEYLRAGRKSLEYEITEVQVFNRFDDTVFAEP